MKYAHIPDRENFFVVDKDSGKIFGSDAGYYAWLVSQGKKVGTPCCPCCGKPLHIKQEDIEPALREHLENERKWNAAAKEATGTTFRSSFSFLHENAAAERDCALILKATCDEVRRYLMEMLTGLPFLSERDRLRFEKTDNIKKTTEQAEPGEYWWEEAFKDILTVGSRYKENKRVSKTGPEKEQKVFYERVCFYPAGGVQLIVRDTKEGQKTIKLPKKLRYCSVKQIKLEPDVAARTGTRYGKYITEYVPIVDKKTGLGIEIDVSETFVLSFRGEAIRKLQEEAKRENASPTSKGQCTLPASIIG